MNAAAIHLAFNHFPLILTIAAVIVLVLGAAWRSTPTVRAALVLMVIATLGTLPAYYSGEDAEHLVDRLDGVNGVAIHPHEEAGEFALIVMIVQGVAALAALIAWRSRDFPRWVLIVALVVSFVAVASIARTAYLGGKIHHPETAM